MIETSKNQKETKAFESMEELKYPQEYDAEFPNVIFLDDLKEKEMVDTRVHAMF